MRLERTPPDFPIPRVSVEGTVVAAEDGRPIAGARVTYYFDPETEYERNPATDLPAHPVLEVAPVETDSDGRYRIEGIPFWPGAPRKVGAESRDRFPSSRTIEFSTEGETVRVDLRLGKGGVLRGTVRMADGTPVAGAEVDAWGTALMAAAGARREPWERYLHPSHHVPWHETRAKTGPDGRYRLSPLPRGVDLLVSASSPLGSLRDGPAIRIPEDSGDAVRDFLLDPAGRVEIRLEPCRGPLPEAVHLDLRPVGSPSKPGRRRHGIGDLSAQPLEQRTDTLGGVPPGRYILVARATNPRGPGGQRRLPVTVRAGRTTVVRVPLPPAASPRPGKAARGKRFHLHDVPSRSTGSPEATAAGVVLDAATGGPVKGALVSDIWSPAGEHLGDAISKRVPELEAAPVRTDSRGRFRLGGVPFEAGSLRKIRFEAEGYWTTARVYEFRRPGAVHSFRIRLRRAGVLRGTVRDPEGRPMAQAGLLASVQRWQEDDWLHRHSQACTDIGQVGMVHAATDGNGRYALSPLPFDRWIEVRTRHGTGKGIPRGLLLFLREGHPEERLDFVIDPGGRLAVEVIPAAGRVLSGIRMRLLDARGATVFSSGSNIPPLAREVGKVNRDLHEGLPGGDYRLFVHPKGFAAPGSPFDFRIRRGKTTTVRVRTVARPKRRKRK